MVGRWTMYTGGGITTKKLAGLADYTKESINIEAARDIVEKGLQRTIEEYKKMGVKVFILEENPHQLKFPHEALRLSNPNDGSINSLAVTQQENRQNQLWFSTLLNKISAEEATLIKTNDLLCNDSICPLAQQGKLLYFDDNHLTNAGSMLLSDRLNEVLLNKTK